MKGYTERQYDIRNAACFKKTTEQWGGLSNMSAGYSIVVAGCSIRSVEALYQACRFPHLPHIQENILSQASPMTAKMVGKPFIEQSRPDWEYVRVLIMKWVLRVKLAQNWSKFSQLLLKTQDKPIVELSNKDSFWGAKPLEKDVHMGVNALGRLLMELRQQILENEPDKFVIVPPLDIKDFLLLNNHIGYVKQGDKKHDNQQLNMLDI